ncbi:hypothetical protein ACWIG5_23645 [Streptomyces lydicus]
MPKVPVIRAAAVAALLLAGAGLLWVLPASAPPGRAADCRGRRIASWSPDSWHTAEFARYGDDNTRVDDWTGGDGTHSVRLPDGRTLWLFSDTFLDRIQPPPNPQGEWHRWRTADAGDTPLLRHNSAVVMSRSGRPARTLTGGTAAAPGPFFPDPPGGGRRWPVGASVESRTPGAHEKVVRVLLWNRAPGTGPWIFGLPYGTEVATLSLPGLHLEGITETAGRTSADPGRRVLYGTAAVRAGGWTYVFGGDDPPWSPAGRRGVGSAFSVVRDGPAWLLFTMDTGGGGAAGLRALTTYWSCSPHGPWHGPDGRLTPPRPPAPDPQYVAAYNPQVHPEFTANAEFLLSYYINWLGPPGVPPDARLNGDVELYRPRFLRVRTGPAGR